MIIEKSVMKTEVKFNDNKEYRYLLKKEWDVKKKKAMVIMINPSIANEVSMDFTTLYTLNNLQKLGYGSVDIVNLYPKVTNKLKVDEVSVEEIKINDDLILEIAEKVDTIIIAWGKKGENSKKIETRQKQLISTLSKFEEKTFLIADEKNNLGFHPLSPQIRFSWILKPLNVK